MRAHQSGIHQRGKPGNFADAGAKRSGDLGQRVAIAASSFDTMSRREAGQQQVEQVDWTIVVWQMASATAAEVGRGRPTGSLEFADVASPEAVEDRATGAVPSGVPCSMAFCLRRSARLVVEPRQPKDGRRVTFVGDVVGRAGKRIDRLHRLAQAQATERTRRESSRSGRRAWAGGAGARRLAHELASRKGPDLTHLSKAEPCCGNVSLSHRWRFSPMLEIHQLSVGSTVARCCARSICACSWTNTWRLSASRASATDAAEPHRWLDRPDGGRLVLDGSDYGQLDDDALHPSAARQAGLQPRLSTLLPHLSVRQRGLAAGGWGSMAPLRTVLALQLLDAVGLAERADSWPRELSGGDDAGWPSPALAWPAAGAGRRAHRQPSSGQRRPGARTLGWRIRRAGAIGILVTHSREARPPPTGCCASTQRGCMDAFEAGPVLAGSLGGVGWRRCSPSLPSCWAWRWGWRCRWCTKRHCPSLAAACAAWRARPTCRWRAAGGFDEGLTPCWRRARRWPRRARWWNWRRNSPAATTPLNLLGVDIFALAGSALPLPAGGG